MENNYNQPKYNANKVRQSFLNENTQEMIGFFGKDNTNGFLSNFYNSPFVATLHDGTEYQFSCNEQYFMYRKALCFKDMDAIKDILRPGLHPAAYKSMGKKVKPYNDKVWSEHRYGAMFDGLILKFSQNLEVNKQLLDTRGKILVELNPNDTIFGVGIGRTVNGATDDIWKNPMNWNGENLLGFCLMEVRDILC